MNRNRESRSSVALSPKARAARWLIRLGVACLVLAALGMAATFVVIFRGMLVTFDAVSTAGEPVPAQVASDVAIAMIPACAVVPLGLIEILLLIPGVVLRRQVTKQTK